MRIDKTLVIWPELNSQEQQLLLQSAAYRTMPQGSLLHNVTQQCEGLLLICKGQARAFILSEQGKEITLYRLLEGDICLFSASCVLQNIHFDIIVEAEKETELCVIPAQTYKQLMERSLTVANYTNQIMSVRFSQVMWLVEQILFKSMDVRLAGVLLEECRLQNTQMLSITHEKIANHLGSAREVITRMLKYFQSEGIVRLHRRYIEITDQERLRQIAS